LFGVNARFCKRHNRVFIDRLMCYFALRLTSVTGLKTWTHNSCRQINLCNTVATLECATKQKPNCMKLLPFRSLGRRFESVPCTQELHTSGAQTSSCFGATQCRSQPKNFGGAKMFDFRRITLFCLENRLSKHKMTIF